MDSVLRLINGPIALIIGRPTGKCMESPVFGTGGGRVYEDYNLWFCRPGGDAHEVAGQIDNGDRPLYDVAYTSTGHVRWRLHMARWPLGRLDNPCHTLRGHYAAIARALDARPGVPLALADYTGQALAKTSVLGRRRLIKFYD